MTFYQSGNADGAEKTGVQQLRWTTLYESTSTAPPAGKLTAAVRRHLVLLTNSGALMASSLISSVLGFAYWWLAARTLDPAVVGVASVAVSAMTLVGTLSTSGMGTLLIAELPRVKAGREWNLIATCVLVAGAAAAIGSVLFAAVAWLLPGFDRVTGSWQVLVLLAAGIVLTAMTLVVDEGFVGLLASRLQMQRNSYFAIAKLALLGLLAVLPIRAAGGAVLATWVGGIGLSVLLAGWSMRRRGLLSSLRPDWTMLRGQARRAFGHNALNLALFLPRVALPLIVTAVVSAEATAGFYTAWMIFSFLAMVPMTFASTLFAVSAADTSGLRSKTRMALLVCLGAGVPAALVVAAGSSLIMGRFGKHYAEVAAPTLAILALVYIPTVFRQLFVAVCRVRGQLRWATGVAVVAGIAEIAAAFTGGHRGGLTSLTLYFAIVVAAEGLVMAPAVLGVALGWGRKRGVHARGANRGPRPPLAPRKPFADDTPTMEFRLEGIR
ncbi:lipopolysaccharide biosynthesis protein [Longispora albida]|uniref:lipopolysaccharide biosynthesis protein n=1 Tax=Longispora albida TaxID=203523 RepID=UPI00036778AE|nr:lipopolysaccharide biosynthesis protein [Longispora albida]